MQNFTVYNSFQEMATGTGASQHGSPMSVSNARPPEYFSRAVDAFNDMDRAWGEAQDAGAGLENTPEAQAYREKMDVVKAAMMDARKLLLQQNEGVEFKTTKPG